VPTDRVKPSFVIFDIRALWRSVYQMWPNGAPWVKRNREKMTFEFGFESWQFCFAVSEAGTLHVVQMSVDVFQRATAIWSGRSVVTAARHPVSVRVNPASPVVRVTAATSATNRVGRHWRHVSVSICLSVTCLSCNEHNRLPDFLMAATKLPR